jgi:salicylate hydroxylase
MFHRVNMHEMLMDSAVGEAHEGTPGTLKVDHKCVEIDHEAGLITFENGVQAKHDLIIGADGIGVRFHQILTVGTVKTDKFI